MTKLSFPVESILFCFIMLQALDGASQYQMPKWSINPYDEKLFIENKGQYAALESELNCTIRYGFEQGNTNFYLCTNEFIIQESDTPKNNDSEDEKEDDPAKRIRQKATYSYLRFSFGAINNNVVIHGAKPSDERTKYDLPDASGINKTVTANGYAEVVYESIYEGIDLVFDGHESNGLKYQYIVHPYANAALITMNYAGKGKIYLDQDAAIHAGIAGAEAIDHAPKAYYEKGLNCIESKYALTDNSYSISLQAYDHSKTIIIDPWVVNPNFTLQNVAFDITRDPIGNVYVFGGQSNWKVKKFTPAGSPIWTFNTTYGQWYGDFAVDVYGNVFLVEGCCGGGVMKLDSSGTTHWNVNYGTYEFWRLSFNCDDSKLYLCNGYSSGNPIAESINTIDTANGTIANSTLAFPNGQEEPRALSVAPNGNLYIMSCNASEVRGMTPAFAFIFLVPSVYSLLYNGPHYANGGNTTSGQNGISVGNNFFCTSNGATLYRRNLLTGAALNSIPIPGGTVENNSGVYVDFCDNIYVGSSNQVIKYDSLLNQIATYPTSGAVYDIYPGLGGDLLACGVGFIASINAGVCPPTFNPIAAFTASPLAGCAPLLVTFTNTSTGATAYHWDFGDGGTDTVANPTHTYLTTGTDTVTLIITGTGPCSSGLGADTIKQVITIVTAPIVNLGNDTSICTGQNVTLNAGNLGATYLWSTTETTQTISVNTAGTYWVIASYGACADTDSVVISISSNLNVAIGNDTTLCNGQSLTLNAGIAGATYLWSTTETTQTISVNSSGTYSVNVNNGGCTGTDTIIVTFVAAPLVALGNDTTFCSGQPITINAGNPGASYLWSNGGIT